MPDGAAPINEVLQEATRLIGQLDWTAIQSAQGILHRESTCSILVPANSTPQTEAIHLVIKHLLMFLLKEDLTAHARAQG